MSARTHRQWARAGRQWTPDSSHVGRFIVVRQPVEAYGSDYATRRKTGTKVHVELAYGVVGRIGAVEVPCVRSSKCGDCGRRHDTFTCVDFYSPLTEEIERAAVLPCNIVGVCIRCAMTQQTGTPDAHNCGGENRGDYLPVPPLEGAEGRWWERLELRDVAPRLMALSAPVAGERVTNARASIVQPVRTYMGTHYFDTFEDANSFAVSINAPVDRLIHFGRGIAIQWHKSGPYVGPENMVHPAGTCMWCPKIEKECRS